MMYYHVQPDRMYISYLAELYCADPYAKYNACQTVTEVRDSKAEIMELGRKKSHHHVVTSIK